MTDKIKIHNHSLLLRLEATSQWSIPDKTKEEIKRFIHGLSIGRINKGKRLTDSAQLKYINTLKVSLEFFNKPTEQISIQEIEDFEKALASDVIKSRLKKGPYRHSSKAGIRKSLKVFLRWRLGTARGNELAGWLDTREREKTPEYLKEEEVEKLYLACRTTEQRYAIALLFDSGARAEEFMNIRFEDIQLPDGNDKFARAVLKEEYSKTKGRTVALYWHRSFEAVQQLLRERISEGIKPSQPIYNNTYNGMRMFLKRLGLSVLKRSIYPHLFRHSSATYYAPKMNRQQLCYRYGWRFSSNMPDVYISRSGMFGKDLDDKFAQTEIGELKKELVDVQLESKMKEDRILALERKLVAIEQNFSTFAELKNANLDMAAVEVALRKRQG